MPIISRNDILNKNVLSIGGDFIGRVRDLATDTHASPMTVAALVLEGSAADLRRVVPWARIRNIGRDAVMVEAAGAGSESAVEIGPERLGAPEMRLIDKAVVREDGHAVGRVTGFRFDPQTGELTSLETAGSGFGGWLSQLNIGRPREIDVHSVKSVGADAIVIAAAYEAPIPTAPAAG